MSANVQAIFQAILTLTDNTQPNGPYITNLDLENPTLSATQVLNQQFVQVATSPGTTISFSFNAFLVLVWNRSATANLQINLNPTGSTINEVGILGPGGVFVVVDPAKANGWNGLALISGSGTIPATVVLAG